MKALAIFLSSLVLATGYVVGQYMYAGYQLDRQITYQEQQMQRMERALQGSDYSPKPNHDA